MGVASWCVREELPTPILAAAAPFAYLMGALLLAEIYVPFATSTEVDGTQLHHRMPPSALVPLDSWTVIMVRG